MNHEVFDILLLKNFNLFPSENFFLQFLFRPWDWPQQEEAIARRRTADGK